jgi:hypothetical protein
VSYCHHFSSVVRPSTFHILIFSSETTGPIATKPWWNLSSAVQSSWSEGGTTRHNFGRGPSNDYFIKVWFQLSYWFQTRRFLCEFPIGSYVKLRSAVGVILVEGQNHRTHFRKRTIQWLFHQNLVLIELGPLQNVSDSPTLYSRWLMLLKIEISSVVHCCFSISQSEQPRCPPS